MTRILPVLLGLLALATTAALAVGLAAVWPPGLGQAAAQQALPGILALALGLLPLPVAWRLLKSRSWQVRVLVGLASGMVLQAGGLLALTQLLEVDPRDGIATLVGSSEGPAEVETEEVPDEPDAPKLLGVTEPPLTAGTLWMVDPVEAPELETPSLPDRTSPDDARCEVPRAEVVEDETERDGVVHTALSCKRDGIREGGWWVYDASGTLREFGHWRGGRRHGRWTWWSDDGTVLTDGRYDAGREDGLWVVDGGAGWRVFHQGRLLYEGRSDQAVPTVEAPDVEPLTCPEGSQVQGPDGAEQCVKVDAPDVRHGPARWVDQGRLRELVQYRDGKRHGPSTTWHGPWNLESLHGVCDPECPRLRETPYEDDVKHGVETTWWPDGTVRSEVRWAEGEACGTEIHYGEDGTPSHQEDHPPCP